MNVFLYLLLASLFIFVLLFGFMLWSLGSGQMDDLDSPSERALWGDVSPKDLDKSQ